MLKMLKSQSIEQLSMAADDPREVEPKVMAASHIPARATTRTSGSVIFILPRRFVSERLAKGELVLEAANATPIALLVLNHFSLTWVSS